MRIHRYSSAQSNTLFKRISTAFLLASAAAAFTHSAAAQADTTLGSFTLSNYYTPTDSTGNPLSATVTFTYLSSGPDGDNLSVAIANNSSPTTSNELIRDVVFQISDNGNLLTASPSSSATYLATSSGEYYKNSGVTNISAGGTLSYPWSIGSTSAYPNSYDLSSQEQDQSFNEDMLGPAAVGPAYGSADNSVATGSFGPALVPVDGDIVTFDVNIPGLVSTANIQNIYIGYGEPSTVYGQAPLGGYVNIASSDPPVLAPEPSAAAALGTTLAIGGLFIRRRRA